MNTTIFRPAALALALAASLGGCGGLNVWPFGSEPLQERSRIPANAVEYRCPGGQRFYVRWLDGGEAAWVILSDREVRLDKTAGAATRYSNGITSLDVEAGNARLSDRSSTLDGCKTASGS